MNAVRRVGRVAAWYARDRVTRPTARAADDVPAFPTSVSSEWLTAQLCASRDCSVREWAYEPLSRGSTCRGRYTLVYDGDAGDAPSTVFSKSTATFRTRVQLGSTGALRAELRFYREIRPALDVLAPLGLGGATERRSGRGLLLIEDIARSRSATFVDPCSLVVDRDGASSIVSTLASLHGRFLGDRDLARRHPWVISSLELQLHLDRLVEFESRMQLGVDRAADVLPPELVARRRDLHDALLRTLAAGDADATTLVHTDVHLGNWFTTPDGRFGLCDWAAAARGLGPRDVAYALMSALTIEDRRRWERDLLAEYAGRLAEVAGRAVPVESVWECYRRQTLHGLCFWLYTIGSGGLQPKTQDDAICRVNLERMGRAVIDLETLALV